MADVGGPPLLSGEAKLLDARPAQVEPELERPSFEIIDILVGWNLGYPGKKYPVGSMASKFELSEIRAGRTGRFLLPVR